MKKVHIHAANFSNLSRYESKGYSDSRMDSSKPEGAKPRNLLILLSIVAWQDGDPHPRYNFNKFSVFHTYKISLKTQSLYISYILTDIHKNLSPS